MNTTHLFFSQGSFSDLFYTHVRDDPALEDARKFVEELWQEYEPYAEPGFLEDTKRHFHQKIWEMYLACVFLKNRFQLPKKTKKEGPDICLLGYPEKIWIEAIAPGSGTGADAVPGYKHGVAFSTPEDKILLRFTHAIKTKYDQYQEGLKKGIINENEPYIIAVNGGGVCHSVPEKEVPYIVRSLFPYGNQVIVFDKKSRKPVDSFHEYRDTINKINGEPVQTNFFEDRTYSGISAVIYSYSNVVIHPKKIGIEIHFVRNPLAENKLPHGIFRFGREWWVENDELKCKEWSQ